jgi:hypothetical protein
VLEGLVCSEGAIIEDVVDKWISDDMKKPSLLETAILRAILVRSSDRMECRLILQLSHALYDGTSLPTLVDDLRALMKGGKLPPRRSFAAFAEHVHEKQSSQQAKKFWRELLQGSRMTQVVPTTHPTIDNIVANTISRTIEYKSVLKDGTSFATILQAAWSVVLSGLAGENDVIFGHLISGRNASLDDVSGPCINIIPVRVRLGTDPVSGSELLEIIRKQYTSAILFENVGYRSIVHDCTNWPKWTGFSSIVQHQYLDVGSGKDSHSYKLVPPDHDSCDVWIISMPSDVQTTIHFNFCKDKLPIPVAQAFLDNL